MHPLHGFLFSVALTYDVGRPSTNKGNKSPHSSPKGPVRRYLAFV